MRLPPVLELSDLAERLNALDPGRWNRRRVRSVLTAGGVQMRQAKTGSRIYVTRAALDEAFPDFVQSLEAATEESL